MSKKIKEFKSLAEEIKKSGIENATLYDEPIFLRDAHMQIEGLKALVYRSIGIKYDSDLMFMICSIAFELESLYYTKLHAQRTIK